MSSSDEPEPEDRPPEAPADEPAPETSPEVPEAAPEAAPEVAAEDAKARAGAQKVFRVALFGIAAALAVVVAIFIGRTRRHAEPVEEAGSGSGSGRALIHAPPGPTLPGDPRGTRLTGVVVDGAGAPVAGAEVSAEAEKGVVDRALAGPGAGSGSASGSGSGSASGSGSGSGAGPAVTVGPATGADGRFAITGLSPGRYRLRVTGPGLLAAEVRYVPVPSDEARIVVARQVAVEGTVVDGGTPVANATIGLRGDAIGGAIETKSDAKGAFKFPDLPEGRYQVYAWKEALAARAVRVNRLGAGPFIPVELRLEAATIVVGRIIDREEGTGLVAAVELRPSGDDQAPRYARSGPDGVFRIEGVPNGRWIADAFSPGFVSPGGLELEAGRGVPELALLRGGTIEGRILDAAGNPIAGATVRALGGGTAGTEASAAVDQDRLRRFSGRMAAPTASTQTLTSDPQLLPRGELGVLVGPIPPIPPPGALAVRQATLDPADPMSTKALAGEPPPLALADPSRASIWTTEADGRYRIRGLGTSSKIAVLASAPGYAEGRSKQLTIALAQTLTGVDIVLSAGTMLVGRVTDQHRAPVVGAQVTAKPEVGAPLDAYTDESGEYRLGPVSGNIELLASAYGHGEAQKKVELPAERGTQPGEHREDLVLVIADAMLAGILDDATGAPVPSAQLEVIGGSVDGRRAVVAADGTFELDLLPAGSLRVRITHPDYPPFEIDAVAGPASGPRVRWRLPLGGAVEGALLDNANGNPLAGIAITGAGPGNASADTSTDTSGRWKLGPLVPGRWRLEVALPGYRPLVRELDVPVGRAPGQTSVHDIRLDLLRGALVGGTVRDGRGNRAAGARLVVTGADGTCEGTSDSEGEFRLRDCPAGDIAIAASRGDERGSVRTTVRGGDEVLTLSVEIK